MRLGAYEITAELGAGGMALVFAARQIALDKRVALKVLRPEIAASETARARFAREGRAAARLHHPNVVDVFDVGETEGISYLVMERLDGIELTQLLRERGPLSVSEVVEMVLPVVSALAAAHDAGIVHRDVKPSNIFIAIDKHGNREPKVLDFGISKFDEEGSRDAQSLTNTEARIGTVRYMSPEQTRSSKNVGPLSDQYSLGVVLYECVTGETPFKADSAYDLMHAIVTSDFVRPRARVPSLPAAFEEVILRAMCGASQFRYPSLRAMGTELLKFASPLVRARWERELTVAIPTAAPGEAAGGAKGHTAHDQTDGSFAASPVVSGRPSPLAARSRGSRMGVITAALLSVATVATVAGVIAVSRTGGDRGSGSIAPARSAFDIPRSAGIAPSPSQAPAATTIPAPATAAPPVLPQNRAPAPARAASSSEATSSDAGSAVTAVARPRATGVKAPPPKVDHGANNAAILE